MSCLSLELALSLAAAVVCSFLAKFVVVALHEEVVVVSCSACKDGIVTEQTERRDSW